MQNKSLNQELENLGDELVKGVVKALIDADKVATGKLIRSVDYRIIARAEKLILEIISLPYLENIIEGREANSKPPKYKDILPWVKKRNIKIKKVSDVGAAIIIARSIGKKGIKKHPEIRDKMNEIYARSEKLLAIAAREDIEDLIDKLLLRK